MKKTSIFLITILVIVVTIFSCNSNNINTQNAVDQTDTKSHDMKLDEITKANNQLYAGLNEMFKGNIEPLNKLWSHSDETTYMGPFGGRLYGWKEIGEDFKKVADMKLGGKISCKDLHVYVGEDIGYASCVEVGENIDPDGKPVSVSHRATNIFHLDNGQWKLVHHHTDISYQLEKAYDKEIK